MDSLFYQLFYREKLSRLVQLLDHKDIPKEELQNYLQEIIAQAEDQDLCNDMCKDMYFCEKKKGHSGKHSEGCLVW